MAVRRSIFSVSIKAPIARRFWTQGVFGFNSRRPASLYSLNVDNSDKYSDSKCGRRKCRNGFCKDKTVYIQPRFLEVLIFFWIKDRDWLQSWSPFYILSLFGNCQTGLGFDCNDVVFENADWGVANYQDCLMNLPGKRDGVLRFV